MTEQNKSMIKVSGDNQPQQVAVAAEYGTVFLHQLDDGTILRPLKAKMQLSQKRGHIYKVGGKWAISGSGYTHLNKVAAINLVTPEYVMVDGIKRPNPYVERDPHSRTVLTVNVRKIGVGFSPAGNITVIDKTLYYNIFTYFIQSVQAKMSALKWETIDGRRQKTGELEHPDCAVIGTRRKPPDQDDKKAWAYFPTMPPLGLWVDYKHPAIMACLDEHTQRQRFGDRIAQKIVERNILKDHPAIGVSQVEPSNLNANGYPPKDMAEAVVTVYGYRHDMSAGDIQAVGQAAARGASSPELAVVTPSTEGEVEVKAEVIADLPPDEVQAAIEEASTEAVEQ